MYYALSWSICAESTNAKLFNSFINKQIINYKTMKKFLLSLVALVAIGVNAMADDGVSVSEVEVRQGKSGVAQIYLNVDKSVDYISFQLDIQLPNGVTCDEMSFRQKTDEGYIDATGPKGVVGAAISGDNNFDVNSSYVSKEQPQQLRFLSFGMGKSVNYGENGSFHILDVPFNVDASIAAGETLTGKVTGIHFAVDTSEGTKDIDVPDVSFDIKVVEDVVILDEESTELPEIASNQKILVKRTINANEWSTLCLPFDMTAAQVYEIFGDDVQLAYLDSSNGYSIEKDEDGNVTNVCINFLSDDLSEDFSANYPYIIKTSKAISEFELTANVNPDDVKESWAKGKGTSKYSIEFIGTYVADTTVPENNLFLSGGNFYYSTGATKMKAFRAYFNVFHILSDLSAGVKMQVNVDGLPTRISDLNVVDGEGTIYTIDGKKMNNDVTRLPKGVYLINGKKVAVK